MPPRRGYWTNQSVLALAKEIDPVEAITNHARQVVLSAVEAGWKGPPFSPFELAQILKVPVRPHEDVYDARTVPSTGPKGVLVEFNPNRPPSRVRYSLAHELAHTFFPDCAEVVRHRLIHVDRRDGDEWQLELLCNIAASELLMPIGSFRELGEEPLVMEPLMELRKRYQVSTEALLLRIVRLTDEPCAIFASARAHDDKPNYRIDYIMPSRSWSPELPRGFEVSGKTVLSECTAVGFTAKSDEKWSDELPAFSIQCIGVPPYPGYRFPRVVGLIQPKGKRVIPKPSVVELWGDATKPRGEGPRIIAHIVNDKAATWGAGFARVVRSTWPAVQDDFRTWAHSGGNLRLGHVHVSDISADLSIVHMVAQHGYGPSPKPRIRYSALRDCLAQLAEVAIQRKATIHMPRIGTGQAGGDWRIIDEMVNEFVGRRGIEVTVYDPPETEPRSSPQGVLALSS